MEPIAAVNGQRQGTAFIVNLVFVYVTVNLNTVFGTTNQMDRFVHWTTDLKTFLILTVLLKMMTNYKTCRRGTDEELPFLHYHKRTELL